LPSRISNFVLMLEPTTCSGGGFHTRVSICRFIIQHPVLKSRAGPLGRSVRQTPARVFQNREL
jgi:alpha-D-ribose 1-methylphosphonate 5-triphosphate synthase subunit PhnL